jgi:hypothetical protein
MRLSRALVAERPIRCVNGARVDPLALRRKLRYCTNVQHK